MYLLPLIERSISCDSQVPIQCPRHSPIELFALQNPPKIQKNVFANYLTLQEHLEEHDRKTLPQLQWTQTTKEGIEQGRVHRIATDKIVECSCHAAVCKIEHKIMHLQRLVACATTPTPAKVETNCLQMSHERKCPFEIIKASVLLPRVSFVSAVLDVVGFFLSNSAYLSFKRLISD